MDFIKQTFPRKKEDLAWWADDDEEKEVNEMAGIVCNIIVIVLGSFLIGFNVCFLVHDSIFKPKEKEKKENTKK